MWIVLVCTKKKYKEKIVSTRQLNALKIKLSKGKIKDLVIVAEQLSLLN